MRGYLGNLGWGSGSQEEVVISIYPTFKMSFLAPAHTPSPLSGLFQNYIARFGHGSAKLARQAQSKEKTLQKMMASGLTERVVSDKVGPTWVKLVAYGEVGKTQPNLINSPLPRHCHFISHRVARFLHLSLWCKM